MSSIKPILKLTNFNSMRNITLVILFFFTCLVSYAQNGLERIIVEKYYISDINDATLNDVGGELPVGSTTYRIYVDMLPGFRFQSCYGSDIPDHPLIIATSRKFFNNEDRGAIFPTFNKNATKNNTVLLDSWVSGGYACAGNLGILKSEDNGVETVVNNDGILKNINPDAGIALTQEDGLITGSTNQLIVAGITEGDSGLNRLLDNTNDGPMGSMIMTTNGLWGVPGGTAGPDTVQNIVLIGQFTTDGDFSFELNVQVGKIGTVEQYVARNREGDEITIPSLVYPLSVNTDDYFFSKVSKFELSPNIVSESLVIPQNMLSMIDYKYEIFEVTGALVHSGHVNINSALIPTHNLQSGLHFIRIYDNKQIKVAKFVKM